WRSTGIDEDYPFVTVECPVPICSCLSASDLDVPGSGDFWNRIPLIQLRDALPITLEPLEVRIRAFALRERRGSETDNGDDKQSERSTHLLLSSLNVNSLANRTRSVFCRTPSISIHEDELLHVEQHVRQVRPRPRVHAAVLLALLAQKRL